jgi:hypothetical protein
MDKILDFYREDAGTLRNGLSKQLPLRLGGEESLL